MRILIVSSYAPPHIGGVEVLVEQEVRMLASAGHQVCLVASVSGDGEQPSWPAGVTVKRIRAWNGLERMVDIPWPIYSPLGLVALWKEVRRSDLVHAHGFLSLMTVAAWVFARLTRPRPRMILTEHAGRNWYAQRWKQWLLQMAIETIGRFNVRMADVTYACHRRVLDLMRHLGGDHANTQLLLFPADVEQFAPPTPRQRSEARRKLGWQDQQRIVLFVGRLGNRKGVDLLLALPRDRYDLVLCGPGDPRRLGCDGLENVTVLPPRPRLALIELYHAADLLVLPSRSEGNLSLVAQEALLCGLPVLLGDGLGLEDFQGCEGLYFCQLGSAAIHQSIVAILDGQVDRAAGRSPLTEFLPCEGDWVRQITANGNGRT